MPPVLRNAGVVTSTCNAAYGYAARQQQVKAEGSGEARIITIHVFEPS